jgi:hypothetical protein
MTGHELDAVEEAPHGFDAVCSCGRRSPGTTTDRAMERYAGHVRIQEFRAILDQKWKR